MTTTPTMPNKIPYYSQRVGDNWREMGYPTKKLGTYWESRSCGVACVRMAVEGLTDHTPLNQFRLTLRLLLLGAYLPNKGWIHSKLTAYLSTQGIDAHRILIKDKQQLINQIASHGAIIASVGVGLEENRKTGHLVVITGISKNSDIILRHPSSDKNYEWADHHISINAFWSHFSGNVIACNKL